MFDLGMQELIVIFVVALLVFGPQKLPELARSLGRGMAELKRTLQGVKEQIDSEVEEVQKPLQDTLTEITDRPDLSVGKERRTDLEDIERLTKIQKGPEEEKEESGSSGGEADR